MKKTLLFFIAAFCCSTMLSAQDTLSVRNPDEVKIIKDMNSLSVSITGAENDTDFSYYTSLEADPASTLHSTERLPQGGFDFSVSLIGSDDNKGKSRKPYGELDLAIGTGFGICFPAGLTDEGYSPMRQAWGLDFTLSILHGEYHPWGGKSNLFMEFGLEDKSFKIRGDERYIKNADGSLGFAPFAPDKPKWSAFRIFSWNVSAGYTQHIVDGFSFTVGPVVNFNTGSRIKTKWYDANDQKHKEKTKFGKQHFVTYELMGSLNFRNIRLYVKYNPCNLIDKSFGPDFNTWSVGIIL